MYTEKKFIEKQVSGRRGRFLDADRDRIDIHSEVPGVDDEELSGDRVGGAKIKSWLQE
jgi:hypothetical protein